MCVFMSDKPFVAEACLPMSHASASNGLSDIETHIENALCNRPLNRHAFIICNIFSAATTSASATLLTLLTAASTTCASPTRATWAATATGSLPARRARHSARTSYLASNGTKNSAKEQFRDIGISIYEGRIKNLASTRPLRNFQMNTFSFRARTSGNKESSDFCIFMQSLVRVCRADSLFCPIC
jgi:hypothetical protein